MNKQKQNVSRLIFLLSVLTIFHFSSGAQILTHTLSLPTSINVAIYSELPRSSQFESVLTNAWNQLNTGVQLNFVPYDSYSSDPPDSLDVFVFDGMFYQYFLSKNYMLQLPIDSIQNWQGFMNYAWSAVWTNPKTVFAVPYLGCSYVYFYRKNDRILDSLSQNGLDAFYSVMGNNPLPDSAQPPLKQGLLMHLNGKTTDATLYILAQMNLANNYSSKPPMPPANGLDSNVISHLQKYTRMAGTAQANYGDTSNQRIKWFTQGYGRSLVGITENLCLFPQNYLDSVSFRLLPTADTYLPITEELFVDDAAINSRVSQTKLPYAIKLLNLMTSDNVMYNSMIARSSAENPQFLIPVRGKVLANLMDVHPLYTKMAGMLLNYYVQPFTLDSSSKTWLANTKSAIASAILSPSNQKQLMQQENIEQKSVIRRQKPEKLLKSKLKTTIYKSELTGEDARFNILKPQQH